MILCHIRRHVHMSLYWGWRRCLLNFSTERHNFTFCNLKYLVEGTLYFHPLVLDSCLSQLFLRGVANCNFSIPLFLLYLLIWKISVRILSYPHLFIDSGYLFHSWVISHYYHYIHSCSGILAFMGPFKLTPVFFWHVIIFLSTCLLSDTTVIFQAHLLLLCPSPKISHLSRDYFKVEIVLRSQGLD